NGSSGIGTGNTSPTGLDRTVIRYPSLPRGSTRLWPTCFGRDALHCRFPEDWIRDARWRPSLETRKMVDGRWKMEDYGVTPTVTRTTRWRRAFHGRSRRRADFLSTLLRSSHTYLIVWTKCWRASRDFRT